MSDTNTSNFESDQHVIATGYICGLMVRAGLPAEPVIDGDGNYVPQVRIFIDLGQDEDVAVLLTVEPPA